MGFIKLRKRKFPKMSIFEAVDVRKRIEHEHDFVAKLSQQYIRDTPQGIQCAACGMFVVGPEPRRAPHAGRFSARNPKAGGGAGT